jgi:isopentenyldiphosphate isomerase
MQNSEILAVVDEHDQVIDHQPRDIIHHQMLKHRAVHILLFNSQNHLFLQKRSIKKDLNGGLWDTSAAGHVDPGEDYDESACRELTEELGIQADNLEYLFKLTPTPDLGMEFIQVYRCRYDGPLTLAADEIEEGRWLAPALVSERVITDDPSLTQTFKTIWQSYLKQHHD